MKAFWWFKDQEIAGMARPGFNCTPWFDFPYDEAILVGWIGQYSSGSTSIADFHQHVRAYGSKIRGFYNLTDDSAEQKLHALFEKDGIIEVSKRVMARSSLLEHADVIDSKLHFQFSKNRLETEIDFLRGQGIKQIITLTERHNDKDKLDKYFDTTHFSINDLGAPSFDQVQKLADLLQEAPKNQKRVAVHCLAGIGRTSTMLIGAHILLGEKLDHLKKHVFQRNPSYAFTGQQAEFILSIAERYGA